MSATIDERVIEMRFDNQDFERNVKTTMNTLTDLKKGLDMSESAKSLQEIGKVTKTFSFEGIATGVEAVQNKFSAMSIFAITALHNISNAAYQTGVNMISALTIEPVKTGFTEYELKMNSIQTIMAGTGESLETVNKYLNELNQYSDETIYSFSDMTSNIGKFTNAGVKLEDAVAAMKGIANEAALSGANANEASRAMYNFGQAISSGYVKLIDWKSIELANMATVEFKNELIKTGLEMGTVVKVGDKYQSTTTDLTGKVSELFDATQMFNNSLASQWLTSDVLCQTLARYADETTDIGGRATIAATELKTFTQMMGTLKESAQSGWAQTWELLVGDFDEAKKLWTNINNVIGGMIGDATKARNGLIGGWKTLEGREMLVESLSNAFNGLMSVITIVKDAFRDIFPAMKVIDLVRFTRAIRTFSQSLVLSTTQSEDLKTTFKGLFSILDLGAQAFKALWKNISPIFGYTSGVLDVILDFTAGIGEFFIGVNETAKETDFFNTVIATFLSTISNGFNSVKDFVDGVVTSLGEFKAWISEKIGAPGMETILTIFEQLHARMQNIIDIAGGLREAVRDLFAQLVQTTAWTTITTAIGGVIYVVDVLLEFFGKVGAGVVEAIGQIFTAITETLATADYETAFDVFNSGLLSSFLIGLNRFVNGIGGPLISAESIMWNIRKAFREVGECLEALQLQIKAEALIKIAGAIAILAGSMLVISLIDSEKLALTLASITALFTELMTSLGVFEELSKGSKLKSTATTLTAMLGVATSIFILAGALKVISTIDVAGAAIGLVSMGAMMTMLLSAVKALTNIEGSIIKGAAGLIIFALAIKSMVKTLVFLSESLSWEGMMLGLTALGGLLGELAVFLRVSNFDKMGLQTSTGLLLLAGALSIMASALKSLGEMSLDQIGIGLTGIGGLLAEIVLFTRTMGNPENIVRIAGSLILVGTAMKIFASVLADISAIPTNDLINGLAGFGTVIGLVTIAMSALSANVTPATMMSIGAGMVLVGAAMKILASALSDIGGLTVTELITGLVGMGVVLAEIAIALNFMNSALPGAVALTIAAGAIAIFAPALALLGKMKGTEIAKSLGTLAGVFVILGVAGTVLAPLIPAMEGLALVLIQISGAIALAGVGFLALGAGIALLAGGFATLAAVGVAGATSIVGALTIIITGIASLIPMIIAKIGEAIIAFAKVIITGAPVIAQAAVTVILSIIDALVQSVPALVDGILTLISSVLTTLAEHTPLILDAVLSIIVSILAGIAEKLPEFLQAGADLIGGLIDGIGDMISDACKAAKDLADSVKGAIKKKVDDFKEVGKNIIDGLINGIKDKINSAIKAAKDLGKSILDAAKEVLDINSPSGEFEDVGMYSGEGFIGGLLSMKRGIMDATSSIGEGALEGMRSSISNIADAMNADADFHPVISPVLDLSNVASAASGISTMFGSQQIELAAREFAQFKAHSDMNADISNLATAMNSANGKLMEMFADAINDSSVPVNVQVYLEGDSAKVFKIVRTENDKFVKTTGYNPLSQQPQKG